jgi:hypothetical protein
MSHDTRYLSKQKRDQLACPEYRAAFPYAVLVRFAEHADYMDEGERNYQDYINTIRLNMPQEYCKQPQLDLCVQRMKEGLIAEKQRAEKAETLVKTLADALRGLVPFCRESNMDGESGWERAWLKAEAALARYEAKAPGAESPRADARPKQHRAQRSGRRNSERDRSKADLFIHSRGERRPKRKREID